MRRLKRSLVRKLCAADDEALWCAAPCDADLERIGFQPRQLDDRCIATSDLGIGRPPRVPRRLDVRVDTAGMGVGSPYLRRGAPYSLIDPRRAPPQPEQEPDAEPDIVHADPFVAREAIPA